MRYKHEATRKAKETFVNHLSFIIGQLNRKTTQRELAMLCRVSVSTLCAVKNGNGRFVSFETLLRIADALRLTYTVTLSSKLGKARYDVQTESGVEYMRNSRVKMNDAGKIITPPLKAVY